MDVTERSAKLSFQEGVFYNPKMQCLRDISVLFLNAVEAQGRLLDSTSATAVRAIRYEKEAGIKECVALDLNEKAFEQMKKNIAKNKSKVEAKYQSIQEYCSAFTNGSFDIVDLDPFGSPAPYICDILKVCRDKTLLMVTATDTAVLCGAQTNACIKIYGSKPMHNELCKESGMRLMINYIIREAAQFNYGVEVLLSVSDLHYMRVFVRLHAGAKDAIGSIKQCGFATFCAKCREFSYQTGITPSLDRICANCKSKTETFGPLFLGKLYDKKIVEKMVSVGQKMEYETATELLRKISNEIDTPFFYSLPKITRLLKIGSVSREQLVDALTGQGFKNSPTQFDIYGIKTEAKAKDVANIVKSVWKAAKNRD